MRGQGLDPATRVEVVNARLDDLPADASWALHGTTSNLRYTTRDEKERLATIQPALSAHRQPRGAHPDQEERAVVGPGAGRTPPGLRGRLAPHAHRLALSPRDHAPPSRDLGEPFDFITWFDYAPEHERDFDALLAELRASEEWTYVEREIDVRLVQVD